MTKGKKVLKSQKFLICIMCILFLIFVGSLSASLALFKSDDGKVQENSFGAVVLNDNSQYKYTSKIKNQLAGDEYLFNDIKLTVASSTQPVYIRAHINFDSTNEIAKDKLKFNSFEIKDYPNSGSGYKWSRFGDFWYLCNEAGNLMTLNSANAGEVYYFLKQTDAVVPEIQGILGDEEFVLCEITLQSSINEFSKSETGEFSVVFCNQYGSTISSQRIKYGGAATIPDITPDEGKTLKCWNTQLDGSGADITNEQLSHITQDLTLFPIFQAQKILVTVVQSEGGKITPPTQTVDWGADLLMHFSPDDGYILKNILIDKNPVRAASEYLLKGITQDVEVSAEFVSDYVVLDINGGQGTQPNVVYNNDQTKFMLEEGNEPTKSSQEFYYYSTNAADNEQGQNGDRYDVGYWYDIPNSGAPTILYAIYLTPTTNYESSNNAYIVIPKDVNYVGNEDKTFNIFGASNSTVKYITLHRTTTEIGERAFADCSNLMGISMSDYVSKVSVRAFAGDGELTKFVAPKNLTGIIGAYAFAGCTSLEEIKNLEKTNISMIGAYAFQNTDIESIKFPSSLTNVGNGVFENCKKLASVNLEETSVESIGDSAFKGCTSLLVLKVPSTLKTLGTSVFESSGLTNIDLAQTGVLVIPESAFKATPLAQIELPKGLTEIGSNAFYDCKELVLLVGFEDAIITTVNDSAFENCVKLKNIEFSQKICESGTPLTICERAFAGCVNLVSVKLDPSLNGITDDCFSGCTSLQTINLGNTNCQYIGDSAFKDCSSLPSLILPSRINSIGKNAFDGCSSLESIEFKIGFTNSATVGDGAFTGTTNALKLYLPETNFGSADYGDCMTILSGKGFAEYTYMYYLNGVDKKAYYINNKWERYFESTITASVADETMGSITPSGETKYVRGSSPKFVITPKMGYKIATITIWDWETETNVSITAQDGESQEYTFENVQKEYYTITATFEIRTFEITVVCEENSDQITLTPGFGPYTYNFGQNATYVYAAKEEYKISKVLVDGVEDEKAKQEGQYIFKNIQADHKLEIVVEKIIYTLVLSRSEGGTLNSFDGFFDLSGMSDDASVSAEISTEVRLNQSGAIGCTPEKDFYVSEIIIDGISLDLSEVSDPTSYFWFNILITKENHSAFVRFSSVMKTVIFDANGGVFANGETTKSATKNAFSIDEFSVPSDIPTPTRTGYNFVGWNKESVADAAESFSGKTYSDLFGRGDGWLYAVWEIKTYTIKSVAGSNGTIVPSGDTLVKYGETLTFEIIPDKGYKVSSIKVDGEEKSISATPGSNEYYTFYNIDSNHEIVVAFAKNTFVVTVDANGGTIPTTSGWTVASGSATATKTVTFDASYGSLPSPTQTGYTFVGWFTQQTGGDKVEGSTIVKTPSDHTLYAHWTPIKYTIEYDGNGATGGSTDSSEHTFGVAKNLTKNGFTKTGYSFVGWTRSSLNTEIDYEDQQSVENLTSVDGGIITLHAVWKTNQYTVVFNPNGGEVSPDSKTVTYGASYGDLPTPTKAGCTFEGWFTQQTGGTQVKSSTLVQTADDHNLYAHWKAGSYSIAFVDEKGSGGSLSSTSYTVSDSAQTITITTPKYQGHIASYVVSGDSTISAYIEGTTLTINAGSFGDITITTIWTAGNYTVKYIGNDATGGSTADSIHTYNVAQKLTKNGFTRIGHIFAGWSTSIGVSATYSDEQSVTNLGIPNDDGSLKTVPLYAVWTPITYTINYAGNGSNGGSTASSTHTYDVAQKLTKNGFTKTGYSFAGWATTQIGSAIYEDEQEVSNLASSQGASVTLFAQWDANAIEVTLDANGGSVSPESVTVFYEKTYGDLPTPTRLEYSFDGWFTQQTGGTQIDSSTKVTNSSSHTLYAHWSQKESVLYRDWKSVLDSKGIDTSKITTLSFTTTRPTGEGVEVGAKDYLGAYLWDESSDYAKAWAYVQTNSNGSIAIVFYAPVKFVGSPKATWTLPFDTNWFDNDSNLEGGKAYKAIDWTKNISTLYRSFTLDFTAIAENYENVTDQESQLKSDYKDNKGLDFAGAQFQNQDGEMFSDLLTNLYSGLSRPSAIDFIQIFPYDTTMWQQLDDGILSNKIYVLGNSCWYISVPRGYMFDIECYDSTEELLYTFDSLGWTAEELAVTEVPWREERTFPTKTRSITINVYLINGKQVKVSQVINSNFQSSARLTLQNATITNIWDGNEIPMPVCYVAGMTYVNTVYDLGGYCDYRTGDNNQKFVKLENGANAVHHIQTFVPIKYSITINADKGTYNGSKTYKLGEGYMGSEFVVQKSLFTPRSGYEFDKLTKASGSKGKFVYEDGNEVDESYASYWNNNSEFIYQLGASDVVLTIKDKPSTFKVTLNKQSGTGGTSEFWYKFGTGTYYSDEKCTTQLANKKVTTPSRTGYAFGGYYSNTNGSGTQYIDANGTISKIFGVASNSTLYAYWIPNIYKVTLDSNGGTGGTEAIWYKYEENAYYSNSDCSSKLTTKKILGITFYYIDIPTKEGYTFGGYYENADGTGTQYIYASGSINTIYNKLGDRTIYAKWTPITYTISYNGNNATGGSTASSTHTYNSAKALTANGFTRTGYTFAGWATTPNGSVVYSDKQSVTNLASSQGAEVNLYAVWTPNIYKITFNKDGGTGGTDAVWFKYEIEKFYTDSSCTTELPNNTITLPTKTGYRSAGYVDANGYHCGFDSNGSYSYENEDNVFMHAQDFIFEAQYGAIGYSITLAQNGGSGGSLAKTTYNISTSDQTVTITIPTRAGYTFSSWTVTGATGGGASASGTTLTIQANTYGNLTVTANWTINNYSITLAQNGGSGGSLAKTSYNISTTAQTVTITVPTRTGYTLSSWTVTGASGGGASASGTTLTIQANTYGNLTVTANWTPNSYMVTANANGGTIPTTSGWIVPTGGATGSKFVDYGSSYGTLPTPTRTGYTFGGWMGINLFDKSATPYATGKYLRGSDGEEVGYGDGAYNIYQILVTAGQKLTITNSGLSTAPGYAFYDGTGKYISGANYGGTQDNPKPIITTTVPSGAIYIRVSVNLKETYRKDIDYFQVEIGDTATTYQAYSIVKSTDVVSIARGHTLTALWTPNTQTLTADANGGTIPTTSGWTVASGSATATKTVTYDAYYGTLPTPTRAGYSFQGWFTQKTDGTQITETTVVKITGAQTLYAHWTANTYTITWSASGWGDYVLNSKLWDFGGANGYTSSNSGSNSSYTTGDTKVATSKVTMDAAVSYKAPIPQKLGHTFIGWYSGGGGSGTKLADASGNMLDTATGFLSSSHWIKAGDTTLYAYWTKKTYSITFNSSNGGTAGSGFPSSYTFGSSTSIPTPTRTGYTFAGWTVTATISGKRNGTIDIDTGVMGYNSGYPDAVYFPLFYQAANVAYTGKLSDQNNDIRWRQYTTDGAYVATGSGNTTTARLTSLWYHGGMSSATTTLSWAEGTSYFVSANQVGNLSLLPKWKGNQYTVLFDANGGTVSKTSQSVTYGSTYGTLPTPTRTGYTFAGWYTAKEGGEKVVETSTVAFEGTQTLYAHWDPMTYRIGLDSQSATTAGTSEFYYKYNTYSGSYYYYSNGTCTNPLNSTGRNITVPTKTGYTFGGYYTQTNGAGTQYIDSSGLINTSLSTTVGSKTLYAKWTAINYTLKIDPNGGKRSSDGSTNVISVTKIYASTETISVRERTGYILTGYTLTNTSTGSTTNVGGATFSFNSSTKVGTFTQGTVSCTLTAQWTPITYTISYNGNNATGGSTASSTHTYNSAKALTANGFTRTGYTFAGWATAANGSVVYSDKQSVTNLASSQGAVVNLYAQWTAITYKIVYYANGGSGTTATSTHTYDVKKVLTGNGFSRVGYNFLGWKDEQGNSYSNYAEVINLSATKDAEVKMYAQWDAKTYTVTFNTKKNGGLISDQLNDGTYTGNNATITYYSASHEYRFVNSGTSDPYATIGQTVELTAGITYQMHAEVYNDSGSVLSSGSIQIFYGINGYSESNSQKFSSNNVYASFRAEMSGTYNIRIDNDCGQTIRIKNFYIYSQKSVKYDSTYGTLPTPTHAGYTFSGWKNASGSTISASTTVKITSDQTLYAQWTAITYSVKFEANGGSGSMANQTFTYGVSQALSANTFTMSGYKLNYWYGDNGGLYKDKQVVSNLTTTAGATITLRAAWTNVFKVSFDKQGGSGGSSELYYNYGEYNFYLDSSGTGITYDRITLPTLSGYEFRGYWTGKNGTGTCYFDADDQGYYNQSASPDLFEIDGHDTTLYANWWKIPNPTITFDTNGGTFLEDTEIGFDENWTPITNNYLDSDLTIEIVSDYSEIDTGNGETFEIGFVNIYTEEVFSSAICNLGQRNEITLTGPILGDYQTLDYQDIYVAARMSSGSAIIWINSFTVKKAEMILGDKYFGDGPLQPTRNGYTFDGWYTSGGSNVTDSTEIDDYNDHSLYAHWTGTNFSIKFNANGGTGTMSNQTHTYGTYKSLTANAFTRTGYKFAGWSKMSGGPVLYTDGQSIMVEKYVGSVLELYAIWTETPDVTITISSQVAITVVDEDGNTTSIIANASSSVTVKAGTNITIKSRARGISGSTTKFTLKVTYNGQEYTDSTSVSGSKFGEMSVTITVVEGATSASVERSSTITGGEISM